MKRRAALIVFSFVVGMGCDQDISKEVVGVSKLPPTTIKAVNIATTTLSWAGPTVIMGYDDGRLARVSVGKAPTLSAKPTTAHGPIKVVDTTGKLAILGKTQPTLYDMEKNHAIMTFSQLKDMGNAAFSPDGKQLFITSQSGKMLVWKDVAALKAMRDKQARLEDYLAKQNGDFSVTLGKLGQALQTDTKGGVIVQRADGVLIYWNQAKPTETLEVLYHKPPLRSIAIQKGLLMVTNEANQLRISDIKKRNMLRWSVQEVAEGVGPGHNKTFVSVKSGQLMMRQLADGKLLWKHTIDAGNLCGLMSSPDGQYVAHCVNNTLTILDSATGKVRQKVWRKDANSLAHKIL